MNPDTIGYVWTGEYDLNTLRVDGEIFESGTKKLRIRKYPDTCGQGLIYTFVVVVFVCFAKNEWNWHFYVKRDCWLFSVNVKLFFDFFVMREKANYL